MDLAHGGHLTHGHPANFSGRLYDVTHYGVSAEDEQIDYDALEAQAKEVQPKLITCGASAYSRVIDFERMGKIAKEVGAYLFVDMATLPGWWRPGASARCHMLTLSLPPPTSRCADRGAGSFCVSPSMPRRSTDVSSRVCKVVR